MRTLIEKLVFDWTVWRTKQKLLRACPALREIEEQERAARRNHKPVKRIRGERSRILHDQLARELAKPNMRAVVQVRP